MNTEKQDALNDLRMEQAGMGAPRKRSTRVRARCKAVRDPNEEVKAQMAEALPHIVRANVEKAKTGSLIHTKWLWGVMEKAPKQLEGKELRSAKASLAALLIEQLNSAGKREEL